MPDYRLVFIIPPYPHGKILHSSFQMSSRLFVFQKVKGDVTLLIIGMMIGYLVTAIVGVLKFFSAEEDIRAYVVWGLGSFATSSPVCPDLREHYPSIL